MTKSDAAFQLARECITDMVAGQLVGKYGQPLQQQEVVTRIIAEGSKRIAEGNKARVFPLYKEVSRLMKLSKRSLALDSGEGLAEALLGYYGLKGGSCPCKNENCEPNTASIRCRITESPSSWLAVQR